MHQVVVRYATLLLAGKQIKSETKIDELYKDGGVLFSNSRRGRVYSQPEANLVRANDEAPHQRERIFVPLPLVSLKFPFLL